MYSEEMAAINFNSITFSGFVVLVKAKKVGSTHSQQHPLAHK